MESCESQFCDDECEKLELESAFIFSHGPQWHSFSQLSKILSHNMYTQTQTPVSVKSRPQAESTYTNAPLMTVIKCISHGVSFSADDYCIYWRCRWMFKCVYGHFSWIYGFHTCPGKLSYSWMIYGFTWDTINRADDTPRPPAGGQETLSEGDRKPWWSNLLPFFFFTKTVKTNQYFSWKRNKTTVSQSSRLTLYTGCTSVSHFFI